MTTTPSSRKRLVELDQLGHALDARAAPRGPEIDEHDLAAQIGGRQRRVRIQPAAHRKRRQRQADQRIGAPCGRRI